MNDTERYMPQDTLLSPETASRRHLLVADDDASTRQFLAGALAGHGYTVTLACDGAEALALGRAGRFDAMLLDCRMPRGGAIDVLSALRGDTQAASHAVIAIATSAEVPANLHTELLKAGFSGVIEKPCQIGSLVDTLAATLGIDAELCVLDDKAGLIATGDPDTMRALRELLRAELMDLGGALDALGHDPGALVERMHQLRSACGFCGATRLEWQAKVLQAHVRETRAVVPAALERFRIELEATVAALAP